MASSRTQQPRRASAQTRRRPADTRRRPARSRRGGRRRTGLLALGGFDVPFLALVLALVTIGLIMVFSASYTYCYYYHGGNSLYYFRRQLIFAVAGIAAMFFVSRMNYDKLKRLAVPVLVVTYVLLGLVLVLPAPEGFEEFHRWISLGPLTFQPSEIAKFAVILFFAFHMDRHYIGINTNEIWQGSLNDRYYETGRGIRWKTKYVCLGVYLLILGSICILVYMENHVSGTLLIFALGIMMMFLAGYDYRWFVVAAVGVVLLAVFVIRNPEILPTHAQSRITSWLDKSYDPLGVRWQTNHALYAIGSGGIFGVGLGNSKMKQLYVSEPQNDFIFSIVCEELGLIGALIIIALFALLVWRGFVIGIHADDKFGALLAMGIVFQVGLQAALNIAVVTDMLPNTGISLPFFSYGGTSLLMLLGEMGVVLAISRTAHLKKA